MLPYLGLVTREERESAGRNFLWSVCSGCGLQKIRHAFGRVHLPSIHPLLYGRYNRTHVIFTTKQLTHIAYAKPGCTQHWTAQYPDGLDDSLDVRQHQQETVPIAATMSQSMCIAPSKNRWRVCRPNDSKSDVFTCHIPRSCAMSAYSICTSTLFRPCASSPQACSRATASRILPLNSRDCSQ